MSDFIWPAKDVSTDPDEQRQVAAAMEQDAQMEQFKDELCPVCWGWSDGRICFDCQETILGGDQ